MSAEPPAARLVVGPLSLSVPASQQKTKRDLCGCFQGRGVRQRYFWLTSDIKPQQQRCKLYLTVLSIFLCSSYTHTYIFLTSLLHTPLISLFRCCCARSLEIRVAERSHIENACVENAVLCWQALLLGALRWQGVSFARVFPSDLW